MKNPTHGSLKIGVNSIFAAQHNHIAALDCYEVKTKGNPHVHLVLRGSNHGSNFSNFHLDEVKKYMGELDGLSITDPCLSWGKTEEMVLKMTEKLTK